MEPLNPTGADPRPSRVLLGVSGGIAAYKSAELARRLVKAGCDVQVVMTAAAAQFIGGTTFQALTGHPVRDSLWDTAAEAAMGHIELARWPDVIVLAPATADLLARLAAGLTDDLLTTLCLASDRPMLAAPAMNRLMWSHAATQANVATLRARGLRLIGPDSGDQACGEVGEGRMSEPQRIADAVLAALRQSAIAAIADPSNPDPVIPLAGRRAVVTAGPTREALDPVRYLSNRSSGKQGFAVAAALAGLGAEVTLIAGPVNQATPAGVRRIDIDTAEAMCTATLAACADGPADLLVGAAAVADYRAAAPAAQKIKKTGERLTLELVRNPDILSLARARFPALYIAGFAAETEQLEAHAQDKRRRKGLDLIAANRVDGGRAFDSDDNHLILYWDGGHADLGHGDKTTLAQALAAHIAQTLSERSA